MLSSSLIYFMSITRYWLFIKKCWIISKCTFKFLITIHEIKSAEESTLDIRRSTPAGVESKPISGEVKGKVTGVVVPTGVPKGCLAVDEAAAVLTVVTKVFEGVPKVKLLSVTL